MTVASTWLQALVTVPVALIISFVSLLYRYRQNGHPFGSRKSAAWAVAVIVVMAVPATAALFLPRVPPAYLGAALPVVLGVRGDRLYKRHQPTEPALWYQVVTLGVRLLLDHLEQQMYSNRDTWCESQVNKVDSLRQLEEAAETLYARLRDRPYMRRRLKALKSHCDAVQKAAAESRTAELREDRYAARKARHEAEEALTAMLKLAYDIGQVADAIIPIRSPQRLRAGD